MAKISSFIIGVILASLIVTVIAIFISEGSSEYGVSYENSSLNTFNKLESLKNTSQDIKDETLNLKTDPGVLDVIGSFFKGGYQSLILSAKSFDIFNSMSEEATENLPLGDSGYLIKTALISCLIIIIFIGIFLSAILKVQV